MNPLDIIKNLVIKIAPTRTKTMGRNSVDSKIKAKNIRGDIAGRDIVKNTYRSHPEKKELPYVYVSGGFGGNGVWMRFMGCELYNLSDTFIFPERIEILGQTINFGSHPPIKPGESLRHTGVDTLAYPATDEDRYVDVFFQAKDGIHYVAHQKISYEARQDGKFNINSLSRATIEKIG